MVVVIIWLTEHPRVVDSAAPKRDRAGRALQPAQVPPELHRMSLETQDLERLRQSSSAAS